jgi:hypothetical protein
VDCSGDVLVVDEALVEEELVGQPSDLWSAALVQLVASADETEGEVEGVLDSAVEMTSAMASTRLARPPAPS